MPTVHIEAKKEDPMPAIQTNEHYTEQAQELPKATPRPKIEKPEKILGIAYSSSEVEKLIDTYEERENAFKKDNATLLKTINENNNYRVNFKNLQTQNKKLSRENTRMKNKIYKILGIVYHL